MLLPLHPWRLWEASPPSTEMQMRRVHLRVFHDPGRPPPPPTPSTVCHNRGNRRLQTFTSFAVSLTESIKQTTLLPDRVFIHFFTLIIVI